MQEAFRLGALGYVVKARAGSELLAVVELVCQGRRFVGAGLASHVPAEVADRQVPKSLHPDHVLASNRNSILVQRSMLAFVWTT